jgi:hypothetical protein
MKHVHTTIRLRLREWLADLLTGPLDMPMRLQRHIEQCPRCQRRVGRYARLGLAMRMIKSQSHPMGLLLQANRRTMAYLQRSIRELPAARGIQTQLPKASLRIRLTNVTQSVFSAAACLLVLLAVRANILSSLGEVQRESVQTAKHLHAHLDELDSPNPSDPSTTA